MSLCPSLFTVTCSSIPLPFERLKLNLNSPSHHYLWGWHNFEKKGYRQKGDGLKRGYNDLFRTMNSCNIHWWHNYCRSKLWRVSPYCGRNSKFVSKVGLCNTFRWKQAHTSQNSEISWFHHWLRKSDNLSIGSEKAKNLREMLHHSNETKIDNKRIC